ncbi:hypothetical protein [Rubrolithibacter danxiaensis]|uniref:hypothetical protein n=1 Tax=Rubrolithibacter danxiaensis TaxID=3390805 RepID=UPI003BF84A8D
MYLHQCQSSHRVANKGNQHRIHLVIDCQVNTWLAAQFDKAEKESLGIVQNKEEIR